MSSFLTPYQQAVLQEMGIPVWLEQQRVESVRSTPDTEASSQRVVTSPSEISGTERIAQLRATLGTTTKLTSSSKAPNRQVVAEKSHSVKPYDKAALGPMAEDIARAIAHCQVNISELWQLGERVEIKADVLSLPPKVTSRDKKQLWQALMTLCGE
ncbi:hypothetical protein [Aestuariibacter sp. A3R04]|uniref:hypothetical protein n=1 Tax=Aestuariibacter sp. A3R04 TaxID=2841571 RepID=UPI001C095333|nr:hypothetical protein [Aestuariibacter sp. A3R04]MBU3022287.1 hypothetical protein [Aestuariibacter sp. A3R04]